MLDDIYEDTRESMDKTIASLKTELKRVRTGRANLSLLDGIRVDYYGTHPDQSDGVFVRARKPTDHHSALGCVGDQRD